jgi:hypothetical protein
VGAQYFERGVLRMAGLEPGYSRHSLLTRALIGTWALPRGVAAMSIHSFVTAGVFDPELLAAMDEVFDAAFEALDDKANQK